MLHPVFCQMEARGSQLRQELELSGMTIYAFTGSHDLASEVLLEERGTRKLELWRRNDSYAGYVIVIDGVGYEFARTVRA